MSVSAATLTQVGLGVFLFTLIVLILVAVILAARSRLVAEGTVTVLINGERELQVPVGVKLMNGLADAGIFIPSACGGGGTCGRRSTTGCPVRSPSSRIWRFRSPTRSSASAR